jgi:hypothetical protein
MTALMKKDQIQQVEKAEKARRFLYSTSRYIRK